MEENIKSKSGIIINVISDHKMIFTCMENTAFIKKIAKFIKIERNNQVSMQNFVTELKSMNKYEKLNQNINEKPRRQL